MKKIGQILAGIFGLMIFLLVLTLVWNATDEKMNPRAQQVVEAYKQPVLTTGGQLMAGLLIDDPQWKEQGVKLIANPDYRKSLKFFDLKNSLRCLIIYCRIEDFEKERPAIEALVKEKSEILSRYRLLLETKDYSNPFPPGFSHIQSKPLGEWINIGRLYEASLRLRPPVEQAQGLYLEAQFIHHALHQPDSLIEKFIYLAKLQQNVEMLGKVLQQFPEAKSGLPVNFATVYTQFDLEQLAFQIADFEFSFFVAMNDFLEKDFVFFGPSNRLDKYGVYFFRKNETNNMAFNYWNSMKEGRCWESPIPPVCETQYAELMARNPILQPKNQVGLALLKLSKIDPDRFEQLTTKTKNIQEVAATL